jgi:hypothetical protein
MREGAVYTIGILAPLVALALVAALGGDSCRRVSKVPGGGFVEWIYPRSAIREVVAYAGVALWLLRELRRRTPDEFRRTLWRAPVIIAIANFLLPTPFVLVHGIVQELFAEQAGRMGVRFLVRILVGYGCVALVEWIQGQLRQDDALSGCRHRPASLSRGTDGDPADEACRCCLRAGTSRS